MSFYCDNCKIAYKHFDLSCIGILTKIKLMHQCPGILWFITDSFLRRKKEYVPRSIEFIRYGFNGNCLQNLAVMEKNKHMQNLFYYNGTDPGLRVMIHE